MFSRMLLNPNHIRGIGSVLCIIPDEPELFYDVKVCKNNYEAFRSDVNSFTVDFRSCLKKYGRNMNCVREVKK
jgi:hypothetical protein